MTGGSAGVHPPTSDLCLALRHTGAEEAGPRRIVEWNLQLPPLAQPTSPSLPPGVGESGVEEGVRGGRGDGRAGGEADSLPISGKRIPPNSNGGDVFSHNARRWLRVGGVAGPPASLPLAGWLAGVAAVSLHYSIF